MPCRYGQIKGYSQSDYHGHYLEIFECGYSCFECDGGEKINIIEKIVVEKIKSFDESNILVNNKYRIPIKKYRNKLLILEPYFLNLEDAKEYAKEENE